MFRQSSVYYTKKCDGHKVNNYAVYRSYDQSWFADNTCGLPLGRQGVVFKHRMCKIQVFGGPLRVS